MDFNKFFQSKTFKIILYAIGGLIIFLAVFKTGMFVGFKKAKFSYKWGENYHRNFAGPRGGFFKDFSGGDFIDAHGIFGQIIEIDPPTESEQEATLIIKGRDDVEKIVLVAADVSIKSFQKTANLSDLNIDDYVVVIGEPNDDGQIEAKLIRILPPDGRGKH